MFENNIGKLNFGIMDTGLALMSYHLYDDYITQHMDCVNLLRIFVFSLVLL